jgi:hypothetical protein
MRTWVFDQEGSDWFISSKVNELTRLHKHEDEHDYDYDYEQCEFEHETRLRRYGHASPPRLSQQEWSPYDPGHDEGTHYSYAEPDALPTFGVPTAVPVATTITMIPIFP